MPPESEKKSPDVVSPRKPGEVAVNKDRLQESVQSTLSQRLVFDIGPEDSLAYQHAAKAVEVFMKRGQDAARSAEDELARQERLLDTDKRKITPKERQRYEDLITEVETWSLTLPALLKQARIVQYDPEVQSRLNEMFTLIAEREDFINQLEVTRFIILKNSSLNDFSPRDERVPTEFYRLAAIATVGWMLRQKMDFHPWLLERDGLGRLEHKAEKDTFTDHLKTFVALEAEGGWEVDKAQGLGEFILGKWPKLKNDKNNDEAFANFFLQKRVKVNGVLETNPKRQLKPKDTVTVITVFERKTEAAGAGIEGARKQADDTFNREKAERVTQGFPGVQNLAYPSEGPIGIWKKLLFEYGGPKEKKRYARQFGESIKDFQKDFLERGALEDFRKTALEEKDRVIKDNDRARFLIDTVLFMRKLLGESGEQIGDTAKNAFTTSDEEFNQVFNSVMEKLTKEFDGITTDENKRVCAELAAELAKIEKGEDVDMKHVADLADQYGKIYSKTGSMLTAFQAWQIRENVGRVGGTGRANNLDLVTRSDNKSTFQSLRSLAPYGVFQPRSYRDEQGRIILLQTPPTPENSDLMRNLKESGKLALSLDAVIGTGILYGWAVKKPILGFLLSRWYIKFPAVIGVPVAAAELSIAGAKGLALNKVKMDAVERMERTLVKLGAVEGKPLLPPEMAKNEAIQLYKEMFIILSAAEDKDGREVDHDLSMEAHVFVNQLMMGIGYPPYHELSTPLVPDSEKLSPESRNYVRTKVNDRKGVDAATRKKLSDLSSSVEGGRVDDRTGQVEKAPDPVEVLLSGKYPEGIIDGWFSGEREVNIMKKHLNTAAHDALFEKKGGKMEQALEALAKREDLPVKEAVYKAAGSAWLHWRRMDSLSAHFAKSRFQFDLRNEIPKSRMHSPGKMFTETAFSRDMVEKNMAADFKSYTPIEIMAISRFLEANPPTNDEILQYWLLQSRPSFDFMGSTDEVINRNFGKPENRTGMGENYLKDWAYIMGYMKHIELEDAMAAKSPELFRQQRGKEYFEEIGMTNKGSYYQIQYGWIFNKYLYAKFDDGKWKVSFGSYSGPYEAAEDFGTISVNTDAATNSYNAIVEKLAKINKDQKDE